MSYSIIICTYNRFPYLVETVEAVLKVLRSRSDYEVIIVDNNSTDGTCAIKEQYAAVPEVRYFLETNQGLSHARNRGLKEAKNDIVIYLDDDIDIVPGYFDCCDKAFSDPSMNICGGKVLPYNVEAPTWLPKEYYYLVSLFDLGDQSHATTYIMGGNFAIRRQAALKIGEYNVKLGRTGGNLMAGEENEYQDRARALGYVINYIPGLTILHKIESKLNKDYVLKYAYLNGKSSSVLFKTFKLKHFMKCFKSAVMMIAYHIAGRWIDLFKGQLYYKIRFEYSKGYLYGK